MKNYLKYSINYLTSFNINSLNQKLSNKNNNIVFCRNFFLFILMLKNNKKIYKNNYNFFVKKQKQKEITILRSPYRHKLTRHQLFKKRYFIMLSLKLPVKNIYIKDFDKISILIYFLRGQKNNFDTNIISLNNLKFSVNFFYINNFIINKFKN